MTTFRPKLADDLGNLIHQGRELGVGERAVDIVQTAHLGDAEGLAGQAQLGLPDRGDGPPVTDGSVADLACLAAGRRDHHDLGTLFGVAGERSPSAERLVVRMGEDTEQAAAHSRTCQGRGHGLAHADCSIRVIQLPSMRRSMSICIEYEATRPLSALVGRSASCTTPTLRQASHWPPRCRPGAHPKRLAGADPSPGLVWWPRRRRRWYSAKSASIMIDTDVHLYEYADRPGTSRLT